MRTRIRIEVELQRIEQCHRSGWPDEETPASFVGLLGLKATVFAYSSCHFCTRTSLCSHLESNITIVAITKNCMPQSLLAPTKN